MNSQETNQKASAAVAHTPKRFRYCRIDGMEEDAAGHWVDYDDYSQLQASHAALLAALDGLLCHFSHEPPMECYATDAQYTNAKKLFGEARAALAKAKGAR